MSRPTKQPLTPEQIAERESIIINVSWKSLSRSVAKLEVTPSIDIFWLRDAWLEDSANLPDPAVLALEIEELEAALKQFAAFAEDLKH